MRTPEVVSIEVVLDGGKKKFRLPDDSLVHDILAGKYGSWKPYREGEEIVGLEKELDTPVLVFRDAQFFDSGVCSYIFGMDGYHVIDGMSKIKKGSEHRTFIPARWFEPGDVLSFVRTPSAYELKQRRLNAEKERQ